jgi:crossover junction endodeoxyribonuclease RuvC
VIRALGLDLSLAATGLARTHTSTGEARLSTGAITAVRSPAGLRRNLMDHGRVGYLLGEIIRAITGCRPQIIAIEAPLLVDLGDASIRLAEVHGALKHWCWSRGIPYVDINNQHVKIYAAGSGSASKEDVLAGIRATYGRTVHVGDHNAADALSLLAMTLHAYGEPLVEVPESHRRALDPYREAWPTLAGGAR